MQLLYACAVQKWWIRAAGAYQEHLLRSATEELYSKFCLSLINLTLNSHMQLVATILSSTQEPQKSLDTYVSQESTEDDLDNK